MRANVDSTPTSCPACGDPVEGDICPQCGAVVTDGADPTDGRRRADDAVRERPVLGLERRAAVGLCYSLTFVSGLAFYHVADDERVRFHAARSLVAFGSLFATSFVASTCRGLVAPGSGVAAVLGATSSGLTLLAFGLWVGLVVAGVREWRVALPVFDGVAAALASSGAEPSRPED